MGAYLTPDPKDGAKHPAIIWITGGDCNSIGDVWSPQPRSNDQTAAAYRSAGIVMMFPSLRGGNDNPGSKEAFYGEVDDVIAAADYLAAQPYVDPKRIYLGGHSTGGTLVLLVSEVTSRFRTVFSFGAFPVIRYPREIVPVNLPEYGVKEEKLRAPGFWLTSIRSPVFVIEGNDRPGNAAALKWMQTQYSLQVTEPKFAQFVAVDGYNHFSILGPANEVITAKILKDTGPSANITLTASDIK